MKFSFRLLRWVILLGVQLLANSVSAADQVADASRLGQGALSLTHYFMVLEDPGHALTLDQVRDAQARFAGPGAPAEALSFGYTGSAYWLRLTVQNSSAEALPAMLEISNARLGSVELHEPDSSGRYHSTRTGSALPFATRPYRNRYFVFPLALAPRSSQVLYLRIESAGAKLIPARLWSAPAFHAHEVEDLLAQGAYFGMALAMALFNLMLFVGLRDRVYLLYVAFVLCAASTLAAQNGLAKQFLWPDAGNWSNTSAAIGFSLSSALFVMLMRHMLDTRASIPKLDRLLQLLLASFLLVPVGTLFSYQAVAGPVTLFWSAVSPLLLCICLYCAFKGVRSARFFALAFGVLFIGNASSSLAALGLLPHNLLTNLGTQVGSAVEMMLLAFALADRFNVIRREKAAAQRATLQAQRRLLENLQSSERVLEARVAERTDELRELNARLEALSATDSLTGIANRRRFDQVLASEWARAARAGQPLALAMLDIDHFKAYNDHYGHPGGDACLRSVANLLSVTVVRAGDVLARYGGEEFAVIAPDTDGAQALAIAQRICEAFNGMDMPHAASPFGRVTASIGVAAWVPQAGQAPASLLQAADQALYRAKGGGRNRAILASTLVRQD